LVSGTFRVVTWTLSALSLMIHDFAEEHVQRVPRVNDLKVSRPSLNDPQIWAVGAAGLVYDLLVRPREMPAALETVRAHPDVAFVIDHLAKPPIRLGEIEPWRSLMRPFGKLDNVACKVSGLVTEADWNSWRLDDLRPFVDAAIEIFGADRLMFGSDWPVCLLAATYEEVLEAARSATASLGADERDQLFGETARHVYDLNGNMLIQIQVVAVVG